MFFGYLNCNLQYLSCLVIRDVPISSVSMDVCFFFFTSHITCQLLNCTCPLTCISLLCKFLCVESQNLGQTYTLLSLSLSLSLSLVPPLLPLAILCARILFSSRRFQERFASFLLLLDTELWCCSRCVPPKLLLAPFGAILLQFGPLLVQFRLHFKSRPTTFLILDRYSVSHSLYLSSPWIFLPSHGSRSLVAVLVQFLVLFWAHWMSHSQLVFSYVVVCPSHGAAVATRRLVMAWHRLKVR
jgi:hypothetical protein